MGFCCCFTPWAFCRGLTPPLAPRRPARPGAGYLRRYACGGGQKCVEVFLQISPLFCGKICKKLRRGLPHWGKTIASSLRNFLPPYPYLSCRWYTSRHRGTALCGYFTARGIVSAALPLKHQYPEQHTACRVSTIRSGKMHTAER